MGSDAKIYIPSVLKTGSGIKKLMCRIHRHTNSMEIPQAYFHFFKIRKVG
jgi:hypothetical protein